MTTAMQIGETARDRAYFCRCFKAGAAVFLHDDGIVAHSTYRNTPREPCAPARTNCDTRGCKPLPGNSPLWGCRLRISQTSCYGRNGPTADLDTKQHRCDDTYLMVTRDR